MGQPEPKLLQEAAKDFPFAWDVPGVKYALESESRGNAITRDEAAPEARTRVQLARDAHCVGRHPNSRAMD